MHAAGPVQRHTMVSHWPAWLAIAVAIWVNVTLPENFRFGPTWLLPGVQTLLAVTIIAIIAVAELTVHRMVVRGLALMLVALLTVSNGAALVQLLYLLISHQQSSNQHTSTWSIDGATLLKSAGGIWLNNVITFALWYWELDRGGPKARHRAHHPSPDLLFPQMTLSDELANTWVPGFVDYLFVSFTASTAFSPTDTLPLTPWIKMLMMIECSTALATIGLVAARAVNILS